MEQIPVINIENFRQWVESKSNGETIGLKASCGKCPLAQYLNENFPLPEYNWWIVNGEHYYPFRNGSDKISNLPEWAKEFVSVLDNLKTGNNVATKEHCLMVLNTIEV